MRASVQVMRGRYLNLMGRAIACFYWLQLFSKAKATKGKPVLESWSVRTLPSFLTFAKLLLLSPLLVPSLVSESLVSKRVRVQSLVVVGLLFATLTWSRRQLGTVSINMLMT